MRIPRHVIAELVSRELVTDIGDGDVTSTSVLDENCDAHGILLAKADGVLCGMEFFQLAFELVDGDTHVEIFERDGQIVQAGDFVARVTGRAMPILAAERTALNFVTHLSGISTAAKRYVDTVAGTNATILDTRKTHPNLRLPEKYAVFCGGAQNHRTGLYDMILVKDNHIAAAGGIEAACKKLFGSRAPNVPVEIEVKNLEELEIALRYPADRILLDNFTPEQVVAAIAVRRKAAHIPFECSGGINLQTVRVFAETGVEFISVGAITHSSAQLDLSLEVEIATDYN